MFGLRPPSARCSSPRSSRKVCGYRESSSQVNVSALAVVSWPARKIVIASSRSWRSSIASPLSASRDSISMESRSPRSPGFFRRSAIIRSTTASSVASARRNLRFSRVGRIGGSSTMRLLRSFAIASR